MFGADDDVLVPLISPEAAVNAVAGAVLAVNTKICLLRVGKSELEVTLIWSHFALHQGHQAGQESVLLQPRDLK